MVNAFDLNGKVAIVTGAAGLLGAEHCECLAEAGATVVAVDLDGASCRALCDRITSRLGATAFGFEANITDRGRLFILRDEVLSRFGRIDVLVNNAAVDDKVTERGDGSDLSRFEYFPLDTWRRVLEVNVTGVFLCCQVLGASMADQGSGSIINIASTYGIVAPDQRLYRNEAGEQDFFKSPAYPASKGAVIALTRFIAAYWGERGVRVNSLSPGGVRAAQPEYFVKSYAQRTPLERMAEPGDFRGALVFLASDASRYMTGANLVVDGGWTAW